MKSKKLNQSGTAHWLVGLLVVALVTAVGVRVLYGSHAAAPSSVTQTGLYASLGDSFTAQDSLTKWNQVKCEVAPTTYPSVVGHDLKISEENLACSGADTDDLFFDNAPGLQLSAVLPSATEVSLLIGINDFGALPYDLVNELASCETNNAKTPTNMQTCQNEPGMDPTDIGYEYQAYTANYANIVQWIETNRPSVHIYLLSYPAIVGTSSCPTNYLTPSDASLYGGVLFNMNQFIQGYELANNPKWHNLTYVDMYTPSLGSNGCPLWTAPGTSVVPILPNHPTQDGVKDMAKVLEKAIKNP